MKRWLWTFLLLVAVDAHGQITTGISPRYEYRKWIEAAQNAAPLDNGLFGEKVSLYNGSTEFAVVDIDLPGNNGLPVQLGRSLSIEVQPRRAGLVYDVRLRGFGNWTSDVPRMAATYPTQHDWGAQRCSGGILPPAFIGHFNRTEYWQGVSVNIPGRGSSDVLSIYPDIPKPSYGSVHRFSTANRDVFDCIPMKSGLSGEGFRMTTAEGVSYYFDVGVSRVAATFNKQITTNLGHAAMVVLARRQHYLLATKIEDRFGNTVELTYNADGHPTRIWASDGREIVATYANGRLASASAHGREWQYAYNEAGDLSSVTQPDAASWIYSYVGNLFPSAPPSEALGGTEWCQQDPALSGYTYRVYATHPSGASGEFVFLNQRHYRNGVHAGSCEQTFESGDPLLPTYSLLISHFHDVMSLSSKSISGPGFAAMQWSYHYGNLEDYAEGLWGSHTAPATYPCATCFPYKTVTVTNPDQTKKRQRFGVVYWLNDGRLLQEEILNSVGVVVKREMYEYIPDADIAVQPFHGYYGGKLADASDLASTYVRPLVKRTITQDGRNFNWEVDKSCTIGSVTTYCFDAYARPTRVTKASVVSP